MGVSVAIMQVVFPAVDCAHDSFHFNYAGDYFNFQWWEEDPWTCKQPNSSHVNFIFLISPRSSKVFSKVLEYQ